MAPRKPTNWALWGKMFAAGAVVVVGGPAFTYWLTPTDEELFERYNPDLKKKSLERRYERQKEFDDFVTNLKRQARSDKPIWVVQEEEARQAREARVQEGLRIAEEVRARKEELRKEAGLEPQAKSS